MAGRPLFALISLILILAALLFELFVILSGSIKATPIGNTYFISAATANIPGNVPNTPRVAWTYFSLASLIKDGGKVVYNRPVQAAFPFQPRQNFGITGSELQQLPTDFRTGRFYYYMSRVSWSCYLIAGFFGVCALVTGLLALCSRVGSFLSGFLASVAAFFMLVAASLMTAWTVKARNAFNKAPLNANARLGKYAYGFTWAAFACYFICMVLFCASGGKKGNKETTYEEKSGKGMFGRRNKSQRNKDGIRDDYS